ncbi:DNA-3-methyladenine glycosylase 2 family protein [Glaciibacter flavus]|uniref:DNA-3-methyladenine glycosylase 2 family protein n=1 Tax=Orlajensenia flava TaxID=2565934 RepID=A0A4S4FPN4_9MICO|nr:DNA-3-methyladenine glycosylase [Glaciibacter flavus]THG32519.1 DNA-3-methyladenine glycosylase 2 family protein [Glaciibacter flavus]
MPTHGIEVEVKGPWSLATSRRFWEGFSPNALPEHEGGALSCVFLAENGWGRVQAEVVQEGHTARLRLRGEDHLDEAATQVARFLAIDIDGRGWTKVAQDDRVIADAQEKLPGLRPCGFYSAYEAAAWSVLSQRIRITQAARLRSDVIDAYGDDGAFPGPAALRKARLDLPGRKAEYLKSVAAAALDGVLDSAYLRGMRAEEAVETVQGVKGLGPFAAELVVARGANAPDLAPQHERRLADEVTERYGPEADLADVSEGWRPFRTWASVHLRALREERLHEIDPRHSH